MFISFLEKALNLHILCLTLTIMVEPLLIPAAKFCAL